MSSLEMTELVEGRTYKKVNGVMSSQIIDYSDLSNLKKSSQGFKNKSQELAFILVQQ